MWNRKYFPSHLANAPVWFGLVPMPCYALRHASLCLKEACRPSQSHKDRVKKTAATATGNATGNNWCHLCQVSFTQSTKATTLIILTQRTFSYGQREKIDQGGTWEIFWAEKTVELQVANRFFSLPFGWYFYHVSPTQGASKLGASRSESQKKSREVYVVYECVRYLMIYMYMYTNVYIYRERECWWYIWCTKFL